jgi:hypothetical protein
MIWPSFTPEILAAAEDSFWASLVVSSRGWLPRRTRPVRISAVAGSTVHD